MPGEGQVYKLYVGNAFINYLAPGEDVLVLEAPNGTRTVVIDSAGAIDGLGGPLTITATNANALAVGRQGTTAPALKVSTVTASSATGIEIIAAAAAGGVAVRAISSGTNENLTIDAKGSGTITIAGTSTGAVTITPATTITGLITATAGIRLGATGKVGLGTPEQATVASGVLTVTKGYANVLPESSTTDTVDSITAAWAAEGDYLQLMSTATNTITFDNSATMLLGAGTRAVAPGGSILFQKVGTTWVERQFLTAAS